MFNLVRRHERALFSRWRPSACLILSTTATFSTRSPLSSGDVTVPAPKRATKLHKETRKRGSQVLEEKHPLASELAATGLWSAVRKKEEPRPKLKAGRPRKGVGRKKGAKTEEEPPEDGLESGGKPIGDKARVNIVSADLVGDIISYLGPTLGRHQGCDLISVYPGAGLFDKALHDAVQPRSHLLLEPDEAFYQPFLKPLLDRKGVRIIPKSGVVWDELNQVLTPEYLPDQVEVSQNLEEPPPRNDTLLVTMNLCMFPKRRYSGFDSVSRLVAYQLIQSMRNSTLFQKYGQVRMLVWVPDDEKNQLVPRTLSHRHKVAWTGEMCTEYIAQVCSQDRSTEANPEKAATSGVAKRAGERMRHGHLDLESTRQALVRMREGGFVTPAGRKTGILKTVEEFGLSLDKPISLTEPPVTEGKFLSVEYQRLLERHEKRALEAGSPERIRLQRLKYYHARQGREETRIFDMVRRHDEIVQAFTEAWQATTSSGREKRLAEARKMEVEFDEDFEKLSCQMRHYVLHTRDEVHLLRQPPALGNTLCWDRRPYEPLTVQDSEFFPNVPCTLIDIQPKAPHPILRASGAGNSHVSDIFDLIVGSLMWSSRSRVNDQLEQIWSGTKDGILDKLTALRDPAQGGVPLTGCGALTVGVLNQTQLMQIVDEFMKWPFRPSFADMVGRLADENAGGDESDVDYALSTMFRNATVNVSEGFSN